MTDRIDFISEYCDRWCERCPFTERCSSFALTAAMAMADDAEEAFQLALGRPRSPDGKQDEPPPWKEELFNIEPTAAEIEEVDRQFAATRRRIRRTALMMLADDFSRTAAAWLQVNEAALTTAADAAVTDAVAVVRNDYLLIAIKIGRALTGHDEFAHGYGFASLDDDPLQSDWNGSAKIALIAVTRCEPAWTLLAEATGDDGARRLARQLADIKVELRRTFPDAEQFVRPGFDELSLPSG